MSYTKFCISPNYDIIGYFRSIFYTNVFILFTYFHFFLFNSCYQTRCLHSIWITYLNSDFSAPQINGFRKKETEIHIPVYTSRGGAGETSCCKLRNDCTWNLKRQNLFFLLQFFTEEHYKASWLTTLQTGMAQERKVLQWVIKPEHHCYTPAEMRYLHRAQWILKYNTDHSHSLVTLLPIHSLLYHYCRLQNCFSPRLWDSSIHVSLGLLTHASRPRLTQLGQFSHSDSTHAFLMLTFTFTSFRYSFISRLDELGRRVQQGNTFTFSQWMHYFLFDHRLYKKGGQLERSPQSFQVGPRKH